MPKNLTSSHPVRCVNLVSLSAGILGENFIKHELELGMQRLQALGCKVKHTTNACAGMAFLKDNPQAQAADLLEALQDPETDLIFCAIGGETTYSLTPNLFNLEQIADLQHPSHPLVQALTLTPEQEAHWLAAGYRLPRQKLFLGFSDTTWNHLQLQTQGLVTFYGQAFLPDVCELGEEMFPYTAEYFQQLLAGKITQLRPSPVYYQDRVDFSASQLGVNMPACTNLGWLLLGGSPKFSGRLWGGCIESLVDAFTTGRHSDSVQVAQNYRLLDSLTGHAASHSEPTALHSQATSASGSTGTESTASGSESTAVNLEPTVILLETSEEDPSPEKLEAYLQTLVAGGVFKQATGVLIGRPINPERFDSYQEVYKRVLLQAYPELSLVYNLSIGHATPRAIVPLNAHADVDVTAQVINFSY